MASKRNLKQFVVRKYIMATCAKDAIRKDATAPVDDVWVDEEWKKKQMEQLFPAVGFDVQHNEE